MKALVRDRYGDVDQVHVVDDQPLPSIGADEVLLRVHAGGVDQGTVHLLHGTPYLVRPAFGLRAPRQRVLGRDVAGRVERIGAAVTGLAPGDEVFGTADAALAEFAAASPARLARAPLTTSAVEAAAVPVSGLTALQAVRRSRVHPGQRVAITGAGGGVGSFAVQIATADGAQVTAVCSASKHDFVRSLGAHDVIDYATDDFCGGTRRFDVIIDIAGNRRLSELRRALADDGTLMVVGGEQAGGRLLQGFDRNLRAPLMSPLVPQRLTSLTSSETSSDLDVLRSLIDGGAVRPAITATFTLDEGRVALARVAQGHSTGKTVVIVNPSQPG